MPPDFRQISKHPGGFKALTCHDGFEALNVSPKRSKAKEFHSTCHQLAQYLFVIVNYYLKLSYSQKLCVLSLGYHLWIRFLKCYPASESKPCQSQGERAG